MLYLGSILFCICTCFLLFHRIESTDLLKRRSLSHDKTQRCCYTTVTVKKNEANNNVWKGIMMFSNMRMLCWKLEGQNDALIPRGNKKLIWLTLIIWKQVCNYSSCHLFSLFNLFYLKAKSLVFFPFHLSESEIIFIKLFFLLKRKCSSSRDLRRSDKCISKTLINNPTTSLFGIETTDYWKFDNFLPSVL